MRSIAIWLAFLVWALISWRWYTCGVKGFCGAEGREQLAVSLEERARPSLAPVDADATLDLGDETCDVYLGSYIKSFANNPTSEVEKLERFLNEYENEELVVDGVYKAADVAAVMRFQRKYKDDVLFPWGETQPTGYVYKTTLKKINDIYCANK